MDHIFGDVSELVKGKGFCDIHGKQCPLPKVDLLISGPACTSVSGENVSSAEYANCYTDGTGASGVTYQAGYRDMIETTEAKLSFYENVIKVTNRTWVLLWRVAGKSLERRHAHLYTYICVSTFIILIVHSW